MKLNRIAGIAVGLALVVAACGGDDDDSGAAATETTSAPDTTDVPPPTTAPATTAPAPTTPEATSPATTAPEPTMPDDEEGDVAQAIISLSPTSTEMLYAIGAGDQVIAVDDFSNYPPEAVEKQQGLSGFTPNVEAIAALEPDLVVTSGTDLEFLEQLDTLGIPHWEGPAAATFDDVYAQIEQLGAVTGHVGDAAELVGQMQADIDEIITGLPELDEPLSYYHELDPTYFSVTSDTFIGAVYSEAGLVNVADEVGDGNPFPQLNAEFIIAANPDLIFQACTIYCGETAETVSARPGWDAIAAVENGDVIEMNDDIASRWGPRIVDYLEDVGEAVAQVVEPAAAG